MATQDRDLLATTDAIWKQYKLLFGHQETLRKEAELFLDEFGQDDPNDDVQTYLIKANDGVQICNELCDQISSQAPNLDLVNDKLKQTTESITSRLKQVVFPDPDFIDKPRTNEMTAFTSAKQEQYSLFLEGIAQRKTTIVSACPGVIQKDS